MVAETGASSVVRSPVQARTSISRSRVQTRAKAPNRLTARPPSALSSRGVDRAYAAADRISRASLAALCGAVWAGHGDRPCARQGAAGAAESAASCGFGGVCLGRGDGSRSHASPWGERGRRRARSARGAGGLRRWYSVRGRAELPLDRGARRHAARYFEVCLGRRVARGVERDPERAPAGPPFSRPRARGGRSERPLRLGRRERDAGPRRTAPKKGRSSTGRRGGRPGAVGDAWTCGLAGMTRSLWRAGESPKLPLSSDRVRSDSRVAAELRRSAVPGESALSATRLPPTDSKAALSSAHAQHVGHQCRYR